MKSPGGTLNSTSSSTPSTYHLTSPLAEQILAQACENEAENARRMRMGLKPLPAINPYGPDHNAYNQISSQDTQNLAPDALNQTLSSSSIGRHSYDTKSPMDLHFRPSSQSPSSSLSSPQGTPTPNMISNGNSFRVLNPHQSNGASSSNLLAYARSSEPTNGS